MTWKTLCVILVAWGIDGSAADPFQPDYFVHSGMCDASAGAILSDQYFVVANDEDNFLRIYRRDRSGGPVMVSELGSFLDEDEKHPETDVEGAAWLDNRLYWITSHGRNKGGKFRESRHRFFATEVTQTSQGVQLVPVDKPYKYLLRDLIKDRRLRPLGLLEASQFAPKDEGGLNIEALCPTPEGRLWVGFRNPIPNGRALIVPFLNPAGVLKGQSAQFGEPVLLDLDGYGIRDMAWNGGEYLIIAGSHNSEGTSRLYRWDGKTSDPALVRGIDFKGFNPEAVIVDPKHPQRLLILSDDGTLRIGGTDCKEVADPDLRRFRSRWVTLPQSQ